MYSNSELVNRGISYLESHKGTKIPNWWDIDLDTLDMSSGTDCVAGQMFDGFGTFLMGVPESDFLPEFQQECGHTDCARDAFATAMGFYSSRILWFNAVIAKRDEIRVSSSEPQAQ